MNVLALDTSMGVCSAAALRSDGEAPCVCEEEMQRGHAEALLPMIERVLEETGLKPQDLDVIAATQGPGSFTGVRIAIAAARGLASVTKARLFGIDSLTVMARRALACAKPEGPFAVATDARRGMLYLGVYDRAGRRLAGPVLRTPEEAAGGLSHDVPLAVGSGAEALAEAARHDLFAALPSLQPGAAALAEIASEAKDFTAALRPLYLRPPDAKPQKRGLG